MTPRLLLVTPADGETLARLVAPFSGHADLVVIRDRAALNAATIDEGTSLLAFTTGLIVPVEFLSRLLRPAYNVHPASPAFPGRDPHHHAVWRGATRFGSTVHVMTSRVDEGAIVAVELFDVLANETPYQLQQRANTAALRLVARLGARLLGPEPLPALEGVAWGSKKTRRADFFAMTHLSPLIDRKGFERRYHAFDGGAWNNLTLDLHGRIFRIDKGMAPIAADDPPFGDFTEDAFRSLLRALKQGGYRFARYGEAAPDRHVLWRHDVDYSMHRAARLAEIEAEEGVVATYFVNARCGFYNLLEPEIASLTKRIASLGHEIGLHFDEGAFDVAQWTREALELAVVRERRLIETILEAPVRAMSWHNPSLSNLLDFQDELIGGLVNAYSASLRREYAYGSDSNGYWRFKPIGDVIAEGGPRLHLLTHPAWWTPEPLAPSDRIDRAIMGRARAVRRHYDAILGRSGRENVTRFLLD